MSLMAPSQTPLLEITAPEDDMEISYDAGRVENDIDIDLVDGDDDIDYMLEDTRSEQGQSRFDEMTDTGRDDIMYDDDLDEITYAEEEMHEDVPVRDEHLADVSEVREHSGFGQFAQLLVEEEQSNQTQATSAGSLDIATADSPHVPEVEVLFGTSQHFEPVLEEESHNQDIPALVAEAEPVEPELAVTKPETQEQEQEAIQEATTDIPASPSEAYAGDVTNPVLPDDGLTALFDDNTKALQFLEPTNPTHHDGAPELSVNGDGPTKSSSPSSVSSPKQADSLVAPISRQKTATLPSLDPKDVDVAESSNQNSKNESEEANLTEEEVRIPHTTMVDYEGALISLFPPMQEDDADTFLLNDPSLADKTLVDLFRACRQVLGESIDDELDLEIHSADLNLKISEDSVHCMTTSFSQLIDVYVTLSQQDGIDHPEPFFITLTKKFRWSSRLSALYLAADESKGLSEVHAEQYSEDFAGGEEDGYKDDDLEEVESASAQPRTEAKIEAVEGETIRVQETITTTTTDKGPVQDEISAAVDDTGVLDEVFKQGEDNKSEHEGIDTVLEAQVDEDEFVEQDNLETGPAAVLAKLAEDQTSDHLGGVENGDDESFGSYTVQGENDQPPSNTVHEESPKHLPLGLTLDKPTLDTSTSDTLPEDQANALADEEEWPEMDEQAEYDESYARDIYDQEGQSEIPELAAQDWDQIGHEDVHQYEDDDENPELEETNEQAAEHEWTTFDEELDFEVGVQEQHEPDSVVSAPEQPISSGTFRVPDDSAGEEEKEDSITYDDDELDLPPQSEPVTVQDQPSSQSPLGKRGRDDDESDPGSKRLKSWQSTRRHSQNVSTIS